MAVAILAVAALLSVAGCGSSARTDRAAIVHHGRQLFIREHCGSCHALAATGARGGSGPDFDTSERLSRRQIRSSLVEGANGMPSYAARLSAPSQAAVAEFLYRVTHRQH